MARKIETVKAQQIPPPHITKWGYWAAFKYLALPFLGLLAVLDVALYFLFKYAFHSCYGLLCLF